MGCIEDSTFASVLASTQSRYSTRLQFQLELPTGIRSRSFEPEEGLERPIAECSTAQPMYTRMIETTDVVAVEMIPSLAGALDFSYK